LFDTPPDRKQVRLGLVIVGLVFIGSLAVLPAQNIHVGLITGLLPTLSTAMLVSDLITAAILYAQAGVFRSRALTILASGYVFGGLLLIPYTLTYPGAFAANGLLGAKVNTTAWIAAFWRVGVPIAVILYAWLKQADAAVRPVAERPPARVLGGVLGATALAILVTLLTTLGHDLLPPFFINRSEVVRSTLVLLNVVVISSTIAAMGMLFRQKKSMLDMWLLVAMSAWLAQSLLNMLLHSRFSIGAYVFFALVLVSNFTVMLALLTESNRLYARLALAMSAQNRERDARLMSMDAVAVAIAHEVRQPIAAMVTHASAGLRWLERDPPNLEMVTQSLKANVEQGHRASDLIASMRSVATKRSGELTTFNLNELVREAVSLLDRELALGNIAPELALDEALPPIFADRVQMQQVLINLLTNAIQSLGATRGRPRRIAIRSVALDDADVLLDVSDNGIGIAAEQMKHIFDFFFTTKATGTGIGLSLSRLIVEQHGGHLWASHGEEHGATFHLQLPHSGVPGSAAHSKQTAAFDEPASASK
jgi:signal transduction histidine kinase